MEKKYGAVAQYKGKQMTYFNIPEERLNKFKEGEYLFIYLADSDIRDVQKAAEVIYNQKFNK